MVLLRALGKFFTIIFFAMFCLIVALVLTNGKSDVGWVFWFALIVATMAILIDASK